MGIALGTKRVAAKNGAFDVSMAPPCFSNFNVMMAHPHRPFPGDGDGDGDVGVLVDGGPTSSRRYAVGDLYEVSGDCGTCFRNALYQLHQPFETQTRNDTAALKFPGGGGMAASVGFPFTNAQWKELQRQAMIYKYMVASVPVPLHLLIPPDFRNFGSNGLGSRLRVGGSDFELQRCKRTDGKKWRCSRDAAPDQKYCERHLHRGRPRSRKHVELLPNDNVNFVNHNHNAENNKRTRLVTATAHSDSGSSWQLAGDNSLPYCRNQASVVKSNKVTTCDADSPFILANNQPRELDWMVNRWPFPVTINDQDREWRDQAAESSSITYHEEPLHLNFLGLFGSVESDRGNQHSFLNDAPRQFIDAWSSSRNATGSPSWDGINVTENDTSCMPISLAVNRSHDMASSAWTAPTTPGGPLAEFLNLTSATTNITGQSSLATLAASVSSPSGVLQRTLVSFSDQSGVLACSCANCHEIALPWLDHSIGNH